MLFYEYLHKRVAKIEGKFPTNELQGLFRNANSLDESEQNAIQITQSTIIQLYRGIINEITNPPNNKIHIRISSGISLDHKHYTDSDILILVEEVNGQQNITDLNRLLAYVYVLTNFYEAYLDALHNPNDQMNST